MVSQAGLDLDYRPRLPRRRDLGIAIVGCGGVVNYGHLPAYRKAGFRVVGLYDIDPEAARRTAGEHGVGRVYRSLEELLDDSEVAIVDIAVVPWHQLQIVRQGLAARKHLLCQKPLSDDFGRAVEMVQLARASGLKLAVNQQMRWSAGIRASKIALDRGWLGKAKDAQIQVSVETPWHLWPWLARAPRLEVLYHSIHYLDSLRYLFGDPEWVTSRHARSPEQAEAGETKTVTVLDYRDGLQALVSVNHRNWTPDIFATFRFLGTEGIAKGTIGAMYEYPHGRPDTLDLYSKHVGGQWRSPTLETKWFPDAFIGPMASLMEAILTDGLPQTDGADNLETLRIVEAAYRSMEEGRSVRPEEIG